MQNSPIHWVAEMAVDLSVIITLLSLSLMLAAVAVRVWKEVARG